MSALAAGLFESVGDGRMVEPLVRPLLHVHRIGEEAHRQPERQDQDGVDHREQDARLEVADRVANLLPARRYLRPQG